MGSKNLYIEDKIKESSKVIQEKNEENTLDKETANELLSYLNRTDNRKIVTVDGKGDNFNSNINLDEFFLYHILEITYEDKAPKKEAVENILGTFRGMKGVNFLYIILGNKKGINFYLGIAKNKSENEFGREFEINDIGEQILLPSIQGNFRGCTLVEVPSDKNQKLWNDKYGYNIKGRDILEKKDILQEIKKYKSVGMLEGVPGIDLPNNQANYKENFQGTDRLMNVMMGSCFGMVVIAHPYTDSEVNRLEKNLNDLSDRLSILAKRSVQLTKSDNVAYSNNGALSYTEQKGYSRQDSESVQHLKSENNSSSSTQNSSTQQSHSEGKTASISSTTNENRSFSRKNENNDKENYGINDGKSTNDNNSYQVNTTYSINNSEGSNKSTAVQHSDSNNKSKSESYTESVSDGNTQSQTKNYSDGVAITEQLILEAKSATGWIEYIDKVLLARVDNGRGQGIFHACTYLFAERRDVLYRLAYTATSLYSGAKGNRSALNYTKLDPKRDKSCIEALQSFQIPFIKKNTMLYSQCASALSMTTVDNSCFCGSWMATDELSILAGFPQKEVVGLGLREEVDFGLNVLSVNNNDAIRLGSLIQCGSKSDIEVSLNKNDLDKHTFIAGVTGSGKTTTCMNILMECDLPFLVIEPAKTEYRELNSSDKFSDVLYFTPGRQDIAPFFLNPFELFKGESISSRADMLKATFEASFDMEAAIPQIMETAIYHAYEQCGWDTGTTKWYNQGEEEDPFADGVFAFPTLSIYKKSIHEVIEMQGFDDRLKNDYLGSINSRIESLMIGAKGQMLNTPRSVDFADLVKRKVVIELEEIKSGAEKSLLMGFILTNLLQAVKKHKMEEKEGEKFQHITLIEEAHRLLARYEAGDSRNKKQGVEVFSDMLAEVRKYGESLIIVDQIPNKMTPEVLKNTNTKIVHKIFAKDDKEVIGNTMSLKEEQKNHLSNLTPGRAVVFSQGWGKALQVQVYQKTNTSKPPIKDEGIHWKSIEYYSDPKVAKRGVVLGLNEKTAKEAERYLNMRLETHGWLVLFEEIMKEKMVQNSTDARKIISGIRAFIKKYSEEDFKKYILLSRSLSSNYGFKNNIDEIINYIKLKKNKGEMEILKNIISACDGQVDLK